MSFLGTVVYYCCVYLMTFTEVLVPASAGEVHSIVFFRILYFIGASATMIAAAVAYTRLSGKRGLAFVAPVLLSAHCSVVLLSHNGFIPSFFLICALWILSGVAFSIMLLQLCLLFNGLYQQKQGVRAGLYAVFGLIAGAALFFLLSLLPNILITVSLLILSWVCQISFTLGIRPEPVETQKKPYTMLTRKFKSTSLGLIFFSLVFGITASFHVPTAPISPTAHLIVSIAFCCGSLILGGVWVVMRDKASISLTQWYLLPVPVAALMAAPFLNDGGYFVVNAILICTYTCYETANVLYLANMAYNKRLPGLFIFGLGRFCGAFGFLVGWIINYIYTLNKFDRTILLAFSYGIVFILIVALLIYSRPKGSGMSQGSWRTRCDAVCERYGLTQREREIFVLLAKGRNAQFIAGELYISEHTARTHIIHIHRKLGVHKQQEILNLIESQNSSGFEEQQEHPKTDTLQQPPIERKQREKLS
jgi:DNA-binding CsgD family transcriptional regulator